MSNVTPSKPPASDGNAGAVLEWILRKNMQKFQGHLPARLISYDRVNNRAVVQPMIAMVDTAGNVVPRASIANVPVVALGGGGLYINFPLQPGDLGWIKGSDRDISLFVKTLTQQPPNTQRMHSFEDCKFEPDVFNTYTYSPAADALVIGTLDGSTRIEMSPGKISLNAQDIEINGQTVTVNGTSSILLSAAAGAATLTMNSFGTSGTGFFSFPLNTSINGRAFMTHNHSRVQSGGSNSGGVV